MRALYLSLVAILLFATAPTVIAIGGQPKNIGHDFTIDISASGVTVGKSLEKVSIELSGSGKDLRIARIEFRLDGGTITIGDERYDVKDGSGIISQRGTVALSGSATGQSGKTLQFAATGYVVAHTLRKELPYEETTTMVLNLKLFTAKPSQEPGYHIRIEAASITFKVSE